MESPSDLPLIDYPGKVWRGIEIIEVLIYIYIHLCQFLYLLKLCCVFIIAARNSTTENAATPSTPTHA